MTQSEQNDKIFTINETGFAATAREMFRFQYENNLLYKRFSDSLGIRTPELHKVEQIPFLPIHFFKSHVIQTTSFAPQAIFESSGTTGENTSRHFVKSLELYKKSFLKTFKL